MFHVKHGRDGQIRTADLPLRRRPLYPSELRPHDNRYKQSTNVLDLFAQCRAGIACPQIECVSRLHKRY